jgi:hypothetical protein
VEVFFQIVHTRIPLLNPEQFRKRLNLQPVPPNQLPSVEKPLHPALVATVLAWGAKFSEHPLLVSDRRRPGGQSSLARTAIDRARELAEAMKVHRVASTDHVVISLLIEPLQSRTSMFLSFVFLPLHRLLQRIPMTLMVTLTIVRHYQVVDLSITGFHGFWLTSATRKLLDLQVYSFLFFEEDHR